MQELLVTITAFIGDSCPTPPRLGVSRSIDEEIQKPARASCDNNSSKSGLQAFPHVHTTQIDVEEDADGEAVLNGYIYKT